MSNNVPPQQQSSSKPVLWLAAIAAAATALVGVLSTIEGLPQWLVPAVASLGVVATAVGGIFTKNQVTPWADVAAKVTPEGFVIAGPAAPQVTGTEVTVNASGSQRGPTLAP